MKMMKIPIPQWSGGRGFERRYIGAMTERCAAYVLCSSPRSGTTMLCDMLARTGVAGRPNSFFRPADLAEWATDWGVAGPADPQDPTFRAAYLRAMRIEGQGATGVFGLRLMAEDLASATQWLARSHPDAPDDVSRFAAAFGPVRFIHLSRGDKLAEAISYVRAEQSGLWHARPDGTALELLSPTASAGYDSFAITARLNALRAQDAIWCDWFTTRNITPLCLTYETLAADPRSALAQVLVHIGQQSRHARDIAPGTARLADARTARWKARYLRETGGT